MNLFACFVTSGIYKSVVNPNYLIHHDVYGEIWFYFQHEFHKEQVVSMPSLVLEGLWEESE